VTAPADLNAPQPDSVKHAGPAADTRELPPTSFPNVWSFLLALLGPAGIATALGVAAIIALGAGLDAAWKASVAKGDAAAKQSIPVDGKPSPDTAQVPKPSPHSPQQQPLPPTSDKPLDQPPKSDAGSSKN
jgi:hypothetical protein